MKWFIIYSHEKHKRIIVDLCLISIFSIIIVFFYSVLFYSFQPYFDSLWFSLLFQEDLWCGYFLYISVGISIHFNMLIDYLHVFICEPFELLFIFIAFCLMMNYRSLHIFWREFHYPSCCIFPRIWHAWLIFSTVYLEQTRRVISCVLPSMYFDKCMTNIRS